MILTSLVTAAPETTTNPGIGFLSTVMELLADIGIILLETTAIIILIFAGLHTIYRFLKHKHHTVIRLRRWMNVALLFILCSEILRLVTVHSLSEVIVIFCIILIHAAISVLSNWEMHHELKLYSEQSEIERALQQTGGEDLKKIKSAHNNDINL